MLNGSYGIARANNNRPGVSVLSISIVREHACGPSSFPYCLSLGCAASRKEHVMAWTRPASQQIVTYNFSLRSSETVWFASKRDSTAKRETCCCMVETAGDACSRMPLPKYNNIPAKPLFWSVSCAITRKLRCFPLFVVI